MAITIIQYQPVHHASFKQLNLEWLDHYNLTESHDLMILDDPEGTILNNGGYLWMAEADGRLIGSAGLMKEHEGVYEVVKMAVTSDYRGKGISRLLIEKCLDKAREIGAKNLFCFPIINCKRLSGCMKSVVFATFPLQTPRWKLPM